MLCRTSGEHILKLTSYKRGVCKLQLALVNTLVIYKVGAFGFVV